ncbi:GNAT family N-acetyltransferase [Xanthomarina sp. F2636L]|uniref:GNAT family N-acetyltransferase n=1 Tax=Xanthomarina sp. F2636L TaxID=2996018 RepID=UPI00225E4D2B|nr:GNAT family N-acetyltransferase [Xanthomarina sp. F2636L]MCX7551298.1 GNAT family N-acetyltransferase [Xanthomarina sp. F2636L]
MIYFKIFNSYKQLPLEWNSFATHDIFLQTDYFQALETASPNNMSTFYVGVFKGETLVGIAIIQRVALYLKDMFRNETDTHLIEIYKNTVSKLLKGNLLVAGNLTHTGQHGLYFNAESISQKEFLLQLYQAIIQLKKDIKISHKKRIRMIMLKDFFYDDAFHQESSLFNKHLIHKVSVQPNMIMEIKSHWNHFDDYISDLNKKYRDRYKSARKKAINIEKRELLLEDIKEHSKLLHTLYRNVSDHAKINTFILPENHFYSFKKHLKANFKVYGYYLDNQLIGFYTLVLNKTHLETYFLGYDSEHQYQNQLYLNMLYDMVSFGIENNFSSIVYARTAMAIKSSVGAKPKKMVIYMKHTNWIMNTLLKYVFKLMNPKQDWEERHPFKN